MIKNREVINNMDSVVKQIYDKGVEIGKGEVLKTVLDSKQFTIERLSEVLEIPAKEIKRLVKLASKK